MAMEAQASSVRVRIDPAARGLDVLLPIEMLSQSAELLLARIKEAAAQIGVPVPLTAQELFQKLRTVTYGSWFTLLESTPPTLPVDGRVVILVPMVSERKQAQTRYQAVSAGTILARIQPGVPGQAGHDVCGREIPARPPRIPTLPRGSHTYISEDGLELVTDTDGEVVLRNLQIHVIPPRVHPGDFTAGDSVPVSIPTGMIVRGSVGVGSRIEAQGDVYVTGDVQDATIVSTRGSICVTGSVMGSNTQTSVLRAAYDLTCNRLVRAEAQAGRDLRLHAEARQSTLQIGGDLYLAHALMRSLVGVDLRLDGAIILPATVTVDHDIATNERQYFRAPAAGRAVITRHQEHRPAFQTCLIEDVSPGGMRCRLPAQLPAGPLLVNEIVQIKWTMPDSPAIVPVIARVARVVAADTVGLAFIQVTNHDLKRITAYCRQNPSKTAGGGLPSPAQRRIPLGRG